jgi:hypothetical protein
MVGGYLKRPRVTAVLEVVSHWRYKPWTYGIAETEPQITVTFTISIN